MKAEVNGLKVIVTYTKHKMDGAKIYSKRNYETEFKLLKLTTESELDDSRIKFDLTQPEQREYYVVLFKNFVDVGLPSDAIKVVLP